MERAISKAARVAFDGGNRCARSMAQKGTIVSTRFSHSIHEERTGGIGKQNDGARVSQGCAVQIGIAFEVITNTARDCKIDLIALTTRGKTGLKHMLMGNTAERLARHVPCPVLVVRKREHEFA